MATSVTLGILHNRWLQAWSRVSAFIMCRVEKQSNSLDALNQTRSEM